MKDLLITRLDPDLPLPGYAKPGDAGADLYSRIDITLPAGERALIPTGIPIALPPGFAAFVHPRSGMAIKQGMSLVNTPGTIDCDYTGDGEEFELKVILFNHNRMPFAINHGDRIAQMILEKINRVSVVLTEELDSTDRGTGGFGSTGV